MRLRRICEDPGVAKTTWAAGTTETRPGRAVLERRMVPILTEKEAVVATILSRTVMVVAVGEVTVMAEM